jgi:heat shock protein HslJ
MPLTSDTKINNQHYALTVKQQLSFNMKLRFNSIGFTSLVVLCMSLLVSGCTSVPHVDASSMADLKNLSYQGIHAEPVRLRDGVFESEPFVADGVSRSRVQLIEQLMVSGDMSGDGHAEAAVFLTESSGGSGVYTYLAIVTKSGFGYKNIATKNLGDRVQVRALRFAGGTLVLDIVTAAAGDAACCPSLNMRNTYRLVDGELKQITDKAMGRLKLGDLEGIKWSLAELAHNAPIPQQVSAYAVFDEKRVSGSSGCNRFFSDISGSGAYDVVVGPVGATRMMCADDVMQVEDRYLAALQKVSQFGFLFGQLTLGYEENNKPQRLLFIPKPDDIPQ